LCERAPRQKAAESRKIPESGSVIPREGVERTLQNVNEVQRFVLEVIPVIPREGVESEDEVLWSAHRLGREVIPREGVESQASSRQAPALLVGVIPREGVESP